MFDKIAELVAASIWTLCTTYILGLFIMGLFGKWKQHREMEHKQYRIMLHQENGDPTVFDLNINKDRSTDT